jgi:hypothetical protein
MKDFIIYTPPQISKEDEIGKACSSHEREKTDA